MTTSGRDHQRVCLCSLRLASSLSLAERTHRGEREFAGTPQSVTSFFPDFLGLLFHRAGGDGSCSEPAKQRRPYTEHDLVGTPEHGGGGLPVWDQEAGSTGHKAGRGALRGCMCACPDLCTPHILQGLFSFPCICIALLLCQQAQPGHVSHLILSMQACWVIVLLSNRELLDGALNHLVWLVINSLHQSALLWGVALLEWSPWLCIDVLET